MWKSLAAEGGKRERERKKVVYFEALTSGNSLIIACGQLNEQTMLLLPQMPTRMRCGTVGSLSFQPQKGRPPTSTSQKERRKRKKNPRNLRKGHIWYSGLVPIPLNTYTRSVQRQLQCLSLATGLNARIGCPTCRVKQQKVWRGRSVEIHGSLCGQQFQSLMWCKGKTMESTDSICINLKYA